MSEEICGLIVKSRSGPENSDGREVTKSASESLRMTKLYKEAEAAADLAVSTCTLRRIHRRGEIEFCKVRWRPRHTRQHIDNCLDHRAFPEAA
ncbi:MAG TPA: hypothetical protein VJY39_07080 [Acidisphaera sp.]|nr:hypothetical protein [Acidisphaera sp.]